MNIQRSATATGVETQADGSALVHFVQGPGRYSVKVDAEGWQLLLRKMGTGELKQIAVHLHVEFWFNHLLRNHDFATDGDVALSADQIRHLLG